MENQDDSFKYLGHETLGELVAELRNKMGSVTNIADIIKLEQVGGKGHMVEKYKPIAEENLLKSLPLILRYLKEFEQYDLDMKKK
jgi:hypothetical protein